MAIPPKFFPKPLKDFPQLDFSSEISLENKRKNEEKIEKKPISSQIIDIVGHNCLSLSELFPVLNNSHRLRKKKFLTYNDEDPNFKRQ